jgi:hypothetical protein
VRPNARPSPRSDRPALSIIRAINFRDVRDNDRPQRRAGFGDAQGHFHGRLFGDMLRRIWELPLPAG